MEAKMELTILHAIQSIRFPLLDQIMVFIFNDIVGDKGQLWVYVGILLLIFPKTRKCGICVLLSYLLAYVTGDILKDLIARPRPFMVDDTVSLLIKKSTSYSCPSVHSALAFASASSIYQRFKKPGTFVLIFAALVAFSRMYSFVHYPSDILFGAVLGIAVGFVVKKLVK